MSSIYRYLPPPFKQYLFQKFASELCQKQGYKLKTSTILTFRIKFVPLKFYKICHISKMRSPNATIPPFLDSSQWAPSIDTIHSPVNSTFFKNLPASSVKTRVRSGKQAQKLAKCFENKKNEHHNNDSTQRKLFQCRFHWFNVLYPVVPLLAFKEDLFQKFTSELCQKQGKKLKTSTKLAKYFENKKIESNNNDTTQRKLISWSF